MDQWLNDAPTLAYVKELYIWVVLNNNGNLIAWTDDAAEADELSLWVLGYEKKVESGSRNCIEHGGRKLSLVSASRLGGKPVSPQRNKVADPYL